MHDPAFAAGRLADAQPVPTTERETVESGGGAGDGGDPARSPDTRWPPWTAAIALVGGLVAAAIAGVIVDLGALIAGVRITGSHTPPGVVLADTFVQDIAFVGAAVWSAHIGGRIVRAGQLGLRRPGVGWRRAAGMVVLLFFAFLILSGAWNAAFHPGKEKLLENLGTNEGAALLVLGALLTCVFAPVCEEILFRGYIFTALRNWRGTGLAAILTGLVFGGVHAGSAPALDLLPLAALGFGLCLLYRFSGSLYPCFTAHAINNSIAFAALEEWTFQQGALLLAGALASLWTLIWLSRRLGLSGEGVLIRGSDA
jgi:membrane protease YdiL (CAAX protease family)